MALEHAHGASILMLFHWTTLLQRFVTLIAITIHSVFDKRGSIHRDVIYFALSPGCNYSLRIFVLLYREVIGNACDILRHGDLEREGGVHGDVIYSKFSLDATLI